MNRPPMPKILVPSVWPQRGSHLPFCNFKHTFSKGYYNATFGINQVGTTSPDMSWDCLSTLVRSASVTLMITMLSNTLALCKPLYQSEWVSALYQSQANQCGGVARGWRKLPCTPERRERDCCYHRSSGCPRAVKCSWVMLLARAFLALLIEL